MYLHRAPITLRDSSSNSIFVIFVSFVVEKLLHHGTERQDGFAIDFVKHLREAGVDRGEPAENSFVAGKLFETRTCANEVANREEKEKNRQRTENDLPGNM